MGDIIKKKYKFLKQGYIENKNLSINYKNDLITALSIVDKNKYIIFTVLDNDMKFMDIIYEEELIEGLKNSWEYNYRRIYKHKGRKHLLNKLLNNLSLC